MPFLLPIPPENRCCPPSPHKPLLPAESTCTPMKLAEFTFTPMGAETTFKPTVARRIAVVRQVQCSATVDSAGNGCARPQAKRKRRRGQDCRGESVVKAPVPVGQRSAICSQRAWPSIALAPKLSSTVKRPWLTAFPLIGCVGPICVPAVDAPNSRNSKSQLPLTATPPCFT